MKENSIEKDIKILEEFLDLARTRDYKGNLTGSFDEFELEVEEKEYKAIENLLTRYKQLEEENKRNLQTLFNYEDTLEHYEYKIFEELDDYIKLEEISKLDEIGIKGVKYIRKDKLQDDFIPKSKVKEKIEELKEKPNKMVIDKKIPEEYKNLFLDERAILALQELLREE